MNELFLKIVNMSISAGWLILAVLISKLILQKAPKRIHVLLWGIVAIRLLCPYSMKSNLSLIPSLQTIPDRIIYGQSFNIKSRIAPIDHQVNEYLGDHYFEGISVTADHGRHIINILTIIWIIGIVIICVCSATSCWKLYKKISTSVKFRENIFQSEAVDAPFIVGVLKPRIMIPFGIDEQNLEHVIAHEQTHIQHKDHWWKLIGFLILTVYWFHPLIWLSYILFCRDIEFACDESVISKMETGQRADYSKALLECSIKPGKIAAHPLAFGENSVKKRIINILRYKKPAHGIIMISTAICIAIAVCFLTDPAAAEHTNIMQPAETDMKGVFDSYLYVTMHGKNYRYEQIGMDPENVTKDQLLEKFIEKADPENIDWEVYSIKEYPDHSVVLALAGTDYKNLYQYSPSKRSDPDALQRAKDHGNVVVEDGNVTYGQQVWKDFLKASQEGKQVTVRISHYYTLDPVSCSEQYYKVHQEDYPVIYDEELSYNGNVYTLYWKEGEDEYIKKYLYLMHYTENSPEKKESCDTFSRYVLTNDNTVTWEDLWKGMISAKMGDFVEHYVILDL